MTDARPRLAEDTHLDMRMDTIRFQRELKRQVSISDLITAAWQVAKDHPEELRAKLLQTIEGEH